MSQQTVRTPAMNLVRERAINQLLYRWAERAVRRTISNYSATLAKAFRDSLTQAQKARMMILNDDYTQLPEYDQFIEDLVADICTTLGAKYGQD